MWIFMARPARPDASHWAGRRALAAIDAIAWPVLWLAVIASAPFDTGVVGWIAIGVVALAGVRRAHRAIFRNERYWFTTARWGMPAGMLVAVALTLSLLV